MAARNKVTVSTRPTNPRGTTAERRAAHIASLSTQQAELKQEAAERRAKRTAAPPGRIDAAQVSRCETQQLALIGWSSQDFSNAVHANRRFGGGR